MKSIELYLNIHYWIFNKFTVNSLRSTKSLNTEILDVNICTVHFGRISIVTFRYVFLSCRYQPDGQRTLLHTQMTYRKLFISRLRLNNVVWSIQVQIGSFGWGKKEVVWICWLLCKKISDCNRTGNVHHIICFV